MIGNVTGNDTGNVSRTCKHIITEKIKLVNTNLVEVRFDAYRVRFYAYFEQEAARLTEETLSKKSTQEDSMGSKSGGGFPNDPPADFAESSP